LISNPTSAGKNVISLLEGGARIGDYKIDYTPQIDKELIIDDPSLPLALYSIPPCLLVSVNGGLRF
jgi:hypothetical protein